ncbi:Hint domain-containing protein [Thioclava sp. GXIMD2076]|uniref:Hint domain-containing protein n=1 Tax=Thioclava sp. GXIMD2076 TaxID=3131931 RepID=UPI0030CFCE6F
MATYTFVGYSTSDFQLVSGGYRLRPDWEAATNGLTYTFTDDDTQISGDTVTDNVSNDTSQQTVVIRNSSGTIVNSGTAYIEDAYNYTDAQGNPQTFYTIKIGNTVVGYLASSEIQPGVVMSPSSTINTAGVNYSAIHSATYSSTGNNTITGASYGDSLAGGAGDDSISSGAGADTISGGTGNDTILYGQGGATSLDGDSVSGGDGNDSIDDVSGDPNWVYNDTIDAGAGNDTVWSGSGNDSILGGTGDDRLYAEGGNDTVYGGSGNDWIGGGAGNDLIYGEAGSDTILGDDGNDTIYGGDGSDHIAGGNGNDSLLGGADADTFYLSDNWGVDTILGDNTTTTGSDNDSLNFYYMTHGVTITATDWEDGTATDGTSSLTYDNIEGYRGSEYNDSLRGDADGSGFYADMGAGDDTVGGGSGDDTIYGGAGNDSLFGGDGNDYIEGGDGNDGLNGWNGNDTLWGGAGQNTLWGEAGNDLFDLRSTDGGSSIFGGTDYDTVSLSGAAANVTWTSDTGGVGTISYDGGVTTTYFWEIEQIDGSSYSDNFNAALAGSPVHILAGAGDDTITGSAGSDTLSGGTGNDSITGNAGDDTITTGTGADRLILDDGFGNDVVTDFDMTDDGAGRSIDQLDVSALTDAEGNPVNAWDVVITSDGAGGSILTFPNGETLRLQSVDPALLSTAPQLYSVGIPCIAAGTLVATPAGPRPIETLMAGEEIITHDGCARLAWCGQRSLGPAELADRRLRPVELRAQALGQSAPLVVSGLHCLWLRVDGTSCLIRARHLAESGWNGARIMNGKRQITYVHLLLERHAAILANGVWVESFWPGPIGFRALSRRDQIALLGARPDLAAALLGNRPVEEVYGMRLAPVLPRRAVTRDALARWFGKPRPPLRQFALPS